MISVSHFDFYTNPTFTFRLTKHWQTSLQQKLHHFQSQQKLINSKNILILRVHSCSFLAKKGPANWIEKGAPPIICALFSHLGLTSQGPNSVSDICAVIYLAPPPNLNRDLVSDKDQVSNPIDHGRGGGGGMRRVPYVQWGREILVKGN